MITNYQTNNNLIATSFSNKGNKNGFVWEGRFTNKLAGNYESKYDGKFVTLVFKELDGNLMLGINKNWGILTFNVSSYNTTLILWKEKEMLMENSRLSTEMETMSPQLMKIIKVIK